MIKLKWNTSRYGSKSASIGRLISLTASYNEKGEYQAYVNSSRLNRTYPSMEEAKQAAIRVATKLLKESQNELARMESEQPE